jgi:alkanesulfonate monooxygenase SsuD/methylene tetrahydromethanopterin reductase-like flavin-dependent oxidoreductase (luciferase family)
MAKLDFAFWDSFPPAEMEAATVTAEVYDAHLRWARMAEELGYHSYFVIEHQNAAQITSPSVYLCAVAAHTSTLRMGAMIWQLPFHNPIRLAEEVAMLDQLSWGRVEFGTGLGVHEHEFLRWGLDFDQRRPMGIEALEIIQMAWSQDEVTYHGNYWTFDDALPAPKPYQKPHPPIWVAAHSKTSLEYAARNNFNVAQNIDVDMVVAEKFDYFRKVWTECKHPGPMPRIFLQRQVHVAETDAQAREEAEQYLMGRETVPSAGPAMAGRGGRIGATRIGWGSNPRGMGADSDLPDNVERARVMSEMRESFDFSIENGVALIGSPDTVIRQLETQQKLVGYDLFAATHGIGAMPPELVEKSLKLFGEQVIPAFH